MRTCITSWGAYGGEGGAGPVISRAGLTGDWVEGEGGGERVTPRFPVDNLVDGPVPCDRDPGGGLWEGSRHPESGTAADAMVTAGTE